MITNLTPTSAIFLANVSRLEQTLSEANSEISSGKKINVASDDPGQVQALLQLRTEQQQNTQIQANLSFAKADADSSDSALSSAIQLMDRAVTLATQGASATTDASGRQNIAQEIAGIQAEMVSISQTQVQGRYVFSGDQENNPTYQLDLNATSGVDQLSNAAATRQVQDPSGGTFTASESAQQIFDSPGASVFGALNSLRLNLLANNQTGVATALSALQTASDHLNNMEAFYGNVENRIADSNTFSDKYDTQLKSAISNIEDADAAGAALQLTQSNTALQAAFQAEGKMPTTSLFNYLG